MIAIFIKELRDNAKWAALAMLVLAGTFASVSVAILSRINEAVLVSDGVNSATGIGFAACGFLLGLLAVLPDYSVERWAILTHRPIRRWRIFFAKLLAASVLYLLAAGVPLAGLIVWSALPGDVAAPFLWRMMLPRLAHLLAGYVWLAAGMLAAARRARWVGSRLLPAMVALGVSIGILLLSSAAAVFAIAAIVALALVAAAMSAFSAGGEYESQPWAGKLVQIATLGTGAILCVAGGGLLLALFLTETVLPLPPRHFLGYNLDNHGDVFRVDRNWAGPIDTRRETYTDMSRPAAPVSEIENGQVVLMAIPSTRQQPKGLFNADRYAEEIFTGSWRSAWFFLPRERTVLGFDGTTRRRIGSLGPNGFLNSDEAPRPFPASISAIGYPFAIFFDEHRVWDLDTGPHPGTQTFYASPAGDRIAGVGIWRPGGLYPGTRQPLKLVVVCSSSVSIVQEGLATVRIETPLPVDSGGALSIVQLPDGGYSLLIVTARGANPPNLRLHGLAIRTDRKGRVIARGDLPDLAITVTIGPVGQNVVEALAEPPALMIALPLARRVAYVFRWDSLASLAMSLISAIAAWLLMPRFSTSRAERWGWTILAALLGLSAVILLLCIRTARARIPCPHCGRQRLVSENRCEHCGKPFPPPTRTGIEIFESPRVVKAIV